MTFRDHVLLSLYIAWRWLGAFTLCAGRCALWVISAVFFWPILLAGFLCEEVGYALRRKR